MIDIQKIELELEELKERRVKTATLIKAIEFSRYDTPKVFRSSTDAEKTSSLNYAPRSNEKNLEYLDQLTNELREIDQLIFEKRKQLRGLIDAINDRLNSWGIFDAEKIEDVKIYESIISPRAQKAMQLAIRAEDDAVDIKQLDVDKSWKSLSKRLNLSIPKESIFLRISKYLDINWGLGYGAQTSVLTFSFLVFGVFLGMGVHIDDLLGPSRFEGAEIVRGANEQAVPNMILRIQVDNPNLYINKTVDYAVAAGVDLAIKTEADVVIITFKNLRSMDVNQVALKSYLEIPSAQSGILMLYVQSK